MSRHENYWIAVRDDECMKCHQMLYIQKVVFVMGDLCKSCFQRIRIVIWYNNSDKTMEYCVRAFQLITCLSTDVLEEYRYRLRELHPEERGMYNDLSAHKNWLKDDLFLVHDLHGKYTTEVIKVVKFDGEIYLIDKNIDGLPREERAAAPDTIISSELQNETNG